MELQSGGGSRFAAACAQGHGECRYEGERNGNGVDSLERESNINTNENCIRVEQPEDREAISRITYAAFLNHPQHQPGAPPTEHKIVDALRSADALTLSLVYEENGEIIGHIGARPEISLRDLAKSRGLLS